MVLNRTQFISIASLMVAIGTIYTQAGNATKCVQNKVVAPVVAQEFDRLHAPYNKTLDNVSYNLAVVVEMIKIANENNPDILNKAIDRVNNTGKLGN